MEPTIGFAGKLGRWLATAGLTLAVVIGAYVWPMRGWQMRYGATDAEVASTLPGDELTTKPGTQSTRAITIDAPAEGVWPWLVQMGQGKGGLYSYETFENLIGCNITNADRIHPEWQKTQVGDQVRLYPPGSGPIPYTVAAIYPNRALVLGHSKGAGYEPVAVTPATQWVETWTYALEPVDADTTRLLVRTRSSLDDPAVNAIMMVIEPGAFLMERGGLWGIKERAERAAGKQVDHTGAEGWGAALMVVALLAIVATTFSRKWPLKLLIVPLEALAWWAVLFFGHPSALLAALLAVVCVGIAAWTLWPTNRLPLAQTRTAVYGPQAMSLPGGARR